MLQINRQDTFLEVAGCPYLTNEDKETLHKEANVPIARIDRLFQDKRKLDDQERKHSWDPSRSRRNNNLNINRASSEIETTYLTTYGIRI